MTKFDITCNVAKADCHKLAVGDVYQVVILDTGDPAAYKGEGIMSIRLVGHDGNSAVYMVASTI